ncbi:HAMP domain-containing histidine kinase [candidate division KSB1 bacterium]|nr:HAMP domain-containing histidine kinase [candidate division KSB1 bacterium]
MLSEIHNLPLVSELTKLSIRELLLAAVDSVQSFSFDKNIKIKYRKSRTDDYVLGDQEQLLQVTKNLITNAIRFGSKGDQVFIDQDVIQGKRYNDITNFVRVGVRICGLGISKEMFDIIIEKFQNLTELLRVKPIETSGLELSYSQQVIKNLGGNIWIKSQLGKGLAFYFTIPLARKVENRCDSKEVKRVSIKSKSAVDV